MKKMNAIFLIAIMAIGVTEVYAALVNIPPVRSVPHSAVSFFSPTIDGQFNVSEHWELAENMHMAFLQTDSNHSDDYNYLYTSRMQNSLYVMVDLCSDITNTTTNANWIALWFDTDNSRQVNSFLTDSFGSDSGDMFNALYTNMANYRAWVVNNLTSPTGGLKGIFYNITSAQKGLNLSFSTTDKLNLISSANFSVACGFGASPNDIIPHRIMEFNITMSDLGINATQNYGILVQGGGMTSFTTGNGVLGTGFYCLGIGSEAVYSAQMLGWYTYLFHLGYNSPYNMNETGLTFPNDYSTAWSIMLIASMERFYLPCGNDSNGINDLHENPRLMATINATNAKFSPVMNGTFSPTEYWELGENIQAGFLETDTQHIDNYNYIFTGRQNGSLYVLVDECSDITDDPGSGEWISLWLSKNSPTYSSLPNFTDSNGSLGSNFDLLTSELQLNLNATLNGSYYNLTLGQNLQGIFYNSTSQAHKLYFGLPNGQNELDSTANFTVAYGFGSTPDSIIPHAFYKFNITMSDLNLSQAEDYRMAVMGYGTLSNPNLPQNGTDPQFYAISQTSGGEYVSQILSYLDYLPLTGYAGSVPLPCANTTAYTLDFFGMSPRFYFPFGTSATVRDLKSNPLFFKVNNTISMTNSSSNIAPPITIVGDSQLDTCPWKNGSGTWADPYIFRNLLINGGSTNNCFSITNTTKPFIIENCSLSVIDGVPYDIIFDNVSNALIFNNTCLGQSYYGIALAGCINDTFIENTVSRGTQAGIYVATSRNNSLIGNVITGDDSYVGIYLFQSDNNSLLQNTCPDCDYEGIFVGQSSNSTLSGNICYGNLDAGIDLDTSDNCTISGNTCTNNQNCGIAVINCVNDTLVGNQCPGTENSDYSSLQGINLVASSFNTISINNCTVPSGDFGQYGIYLDGWSDNNSITNNLIEGQSSAGICLTDATNPCVNNTIEWNFCNQNYDGIELKYNCNNNTLLANTCTNNTNDGIYLINIEYSEIIGNNCSKNIASGIELSASACPIFVTQNNCTENSIGILISTSTVNITLNTCAKNLFYGIQLDSSSRNNNVTQNWLRKNTINDLLNEGINNTIAPNFFSTWAKANFTQSPSDAKPGQEVIFTDTTTGGTFPLTYQWNFGDGSDNSSMQNPVHLFTTGGNFTVVVTITDADGDLSIYRSICIVITVPAVPILMPITPNTSLNGNVTLSWTTVTGATSYNLYRYTGLITSINDSLTLVGSTRSTSIIDNGLMNGTYYYVITAVNATGESIVSNCLSVRVTIPPSTLTLSPSSNLENNLQNFNGAVVIITCVGFVGTIIILGIPLFRRYITLKRASSR